MKMHANKVAWLAAALILSTITIIGCKTLPSVEQMHDTATAIGYSAGLVANQLSIRDDARNEIVLILNDVQLVVPSVGQTFEEAWTPIARRHVDSLVESGKIDVREGQMILIGFSLVTKGLDYLFVRYPKACEAKELVIAGTGGFTAGFLAVFRPVDSFAAGARKAIEGYADRDAYSFLQRSLPSNL